MLKRCACCGIEKDISEFHKNKRNADGLHSYCKECNALRAKKFNKTAKGKRNVEAAQKKQFESGYFKYGKGAILNMSKSAEQRGKTFNLTEKDLTSWWKATPDVCYYCGSSIEQYRIIRNFILDYHGCDYEIERYKRFFAQDIHSKINDMTIDRKNNAVGYQINNIVKSCWICNSLKSDFYTEEEMLIVGKLIISHIIEKMGDT